MKVRIVAQRDYETKIVELPYYDEENNEIKNIFLLNRSLQ